MERLMDQSPIISESWQSEIRFRSKGLKNLDKDLGHQLAQDLAQGGGSTDAYDPVTGRITTIREESGKLLIHSTTDGNDYAIDGKYAARNHQWGKNRQGSKPQHDEDEEADYNAEARRPDIDD